MLPKHLQKLLKTMVLVAHKYTANGALFLVWRLIVKVMTRLVMNQA